MAEVKTRILLRSDIASNWSSVNPKLLKGEIGICYDPSDSAEGRKIKFKIGDGFKNWNDLEFIADYDAKIADLEVSISELSEVVEQEVARLDAALAKKVEKEVQGTNGKAYIFNEQDGGGAKFVNNDGVESFVGVNDGGGSGLAAQIYADKLVNGKWQGAKIDVTNDGIYYTVGDKSFAERAIPENEIAVKGDVDAKQDKLPDATQADTFLRNDGEGNLSWVKFEIGSANWGHIGGNIEDQEDLMTKFGAIESEIANRYTKSEVYTKTETDTKIADAIAGIKHWSYKVVDVLPEPGPECEHIIYLVPKGSGKTGYKEYVCINEGTEEAPVWKFEEIGDTDIDLSEYRKAADQDVIDNGIKGRLAVIEGADTVDGSIKKALKDAKDYADTLDSAMDERVDELEESVLAIKGKPAYGITSEQISNWNNEVGAKAAVEAEVTRAENAEEALGLQINSLEDRVETIEGKESGWDAKQDAISVGDGLKFTNNKVELDFTVLDCGDASDWGE